LIAPVGDKYVSSVPNQRIEGSYAGHQGPTPHHRQTGQPSHDLACENRWTAAYHFKLLRSSYDGEALRPPGRFLLLLLLSGAHPPEQENGGAMPLESRATESGENGQRAAAVSNAISRLHREYYGRGATRARTVVQGNFVIAFLEDIYTPVERTLLEAGEIDVVRQTRNAFQLAMRERFSTAVEEIMERKVIAFMSQVHFEPDLAAEVFVLQPHANAQTDG
jgi:uncharacterized protein YbcI